MPSRTARRKPAESRDAISTLHRDAIRLQGIIENMLTLARMERPDMNEPVLIQRLVPAQPDLTLKELQATLGAPLSVTTLCVALRQLKLTFKKKS